MGGLTPSFERAGTNGPTLVGPSVFGVVAVVVVDVVELVLFLEDLQATIETAVKTTEAKVIFLKLIIGDKCTIKRALLTIDPLF